jgi:hypothetical protein
MADQWFYARDANRLGPFTSAQLRELAVAGQIQPTDTVWKAGIERGVPAEKVKNLFPPAQADAGRPPAPTAEAPAVSPPTPERPAPAIVPDPPAESELPPPLNGGSKTYKAEGSPSPATKKGRATAIKGAVIVGQDGTTVQYIKKCTVCGHNDASKARMPIKQGTTRVGYYCPKCKKLRQVEIQGIL